MYYEGYICYNTTYFQNSIQRDILNFPFYLGALEYVWPGEFPLYFADGLDDFPFMDLKDFAAFMSYVWVNMAADYQFTVDANPDTGIVMYRRENGDLRRFFCACSNRTASLWCTVLICGIM